LNAINYALPVSSAQVKSAILFAGLHLEEESSVTEIIQTRNHTENLLGLKVIKEKGRAISFSSKENYPEPKEYFIPGDISSAMFFIVLTLLTKNSELTIKNVCLNPTRIEAVNVLKKMGANIQIYFKGESNLEAFGDLVIKSSQLSNVEIDPEIIPQIIDEIPILTIAGVFADGEFKLRGASELRVKESDRIKSLCANFRKLGLNVEELDDGFKVAGGIKNSYVLFDSFADHRIAMAFAILSCLLKDGGSVKGIEHVSKSNPDFLNQLKRISIL
jgi:3-phosphoshikimate 1-carboxyvinyltransferase